MNNNLLFAILLVLQFVSALTVPFDSEIDTVTVRRINNIISHYNTTIKNAKEWANVLNDTTGTWPMVDYTSGCSARLANWPAVSHLIRTLNLVVGYTKSKQDNSLLLKANLALNYWLDNDFKELDCVDKGGKKGSKCPCGTPGLWNRNWFDQEIAVPRLIGDICLVMKNELSQFQISGCNTIMNRAYTRVTTKPTPLTGANLLDVSSIGISLGLLNRNTEIIMQALDIFYSGVKINDRISADGIQPDGSFMQHLGLLYNGNYGKDYINDLLSVFTETKNTNLMPSVNAQKAFETLLEGSEWMIMGNTKLSKLLWQYSTIGRMVSFPYSDKQASGGVSIDIDNILDGTQGWELEERISQIVSRLNQSVSNVNQGELVGTRYFYNADYLVHRASNYIVTMKMYSSRTVNSECLNVQNPFGFHLSDGAIFNYLNGDEYRDIFGAWNWDLIPGITVDVGGTPLTCTKVKRKGKKNFVGGATDGNAGIVVFDYVNPISEQLSFKKTAFFFSSGYAIQIGSIRSTNTSASLVTVLDQRRQNKNFYIDGEKQNRQASSRTYQACSIWHDSIGYYFPEKQSIQVQSSEAASNWSSIGISKGNDKENLWAAYIEHNSKSTFESPVQYIVQPGVSQKKFHKNIQSKESPIALHYNANSPQVNSAYSKEDKTIAIAFWSPGQYSSPWKSITVYADNPCVLLITHVERKVYRMTVADPSQKLSNIHFSIMLGQSLYVNRTVNIQGGVLAGKAIAQTIDFDTVARSSLNT